MDLHSISGRLYVNVMAAKCDGRPAISIFLYTKIHKNLAQNEIGFFIKTFRMGKGLKAKSRKTKQIKSGKN
jgi:hypothetical protein